MDLQTSKIIVNSLMLLSLAVLILTGFLISPVSFQFGLYQRGPLVVNAHDFSSIAFVVLLSVHFYLNRAWFGRVLARRP